MFFRDWWRIETDFGAVRLELDGAGRAGGEDAGPSDLFETERVLDVLTYGIECRHPRITSAVLEAFARRHSIDFTPGTSLDTVPAQALDHLRPTLIDFLKTEVRAGRIQLYQEKIPTRKRERILKFDFAPQSSTREELTFIGVEVKDQDEVPVAGTRVRFELPDGDVKVVTTNSEGIARIDGLALPGNAKISLLDFNEPGDAEPVEQDEVVEVVEPAAPPPPEPEEPAQKEFTVKIVDETGKGIAGIPMVFAGASTTMTVPTDASGVAKWKAATESVEVTFESAEAVNKAMQALWQSRAATSLDAYLAEGSDVVAVTSRPSAVEALGGDLFNSLSVAAAQPKTLSIRPAKKRAVLIEMHDTLFRTGSAVVNPEGEAPSTAVGEHESITTVGLVATILRYNEEHEGKKLFIAGHADRAGDDAGNVKLSEHRAKAVLALVEGRKADYVAACGAKHSEVDVTQLFDWVNRQSGFTCKPTVMDRPPSDENYVKFRKSFNLWVKSGPAEGEKEPRGTAIGDYGRLQPDIWGAMFDLYEYNLRDELGEDGDGVATLRQGLTWVDGEKKTVGFGEKHPTTENTVDGMRSQADRRVEVLMFDEEELPNLAATNGEDVYDGVTFERRRVDAMVVGDADQELRLLGFDLRPVPAGTPCTVRVGRREFSCAANDQGVVKFKTSTQPEICHVSWSPQGNSDAEAAVVERQNVSLLASETSDIRARLFNLGYAHAELEQRVEAFQQEFRRELTRQANDIAPEVEQWHDAGITPALASGTAGGVRAAAFAGSRGGGASSGASGGRAKTTVAPVLKIEAVPGAPCVHWPPGSSAAQGPDTTRRTPDGSIWYMEVLRGSHSAVTVLNGQGLDIRPNNPLGAVDDGPDVWLDPTPTSSKRTIYFYAHRHPKQKNDYADSLDDHVSLIEAGNGDAKRTLLQVKARFYGKGYSGKNGPPQQRAKHHVALQLYGSVLAVQAKAQKSPLPTYKMKNSKTVSDDVHEPTLTPQAIMSEVVRFAAKGTVDHLVLNAHGNLRDGKAYLFLGHDYEYFLAHPVPTGLAQANIGFFLENVDVWKELKGKVRYLWIQGCLVGADPQLCAAIARNSGAWVSAPTQYTGVRPEGLGENQLEYLWDNHLLHYDPALPESQVSLFFELMGNWANFNEAQDEFCRRARHGRSGILEDDLYFNIVDLMKAPITTR